MREIHDPKTLTYLKIGFASLMVCGVLLWFVGGPIIDSVTNHHQDVGPSKVVKRDHSGHKATSKVAKGSEPSNEISPQNGSEEVASNPSDSTPGGVEPDGSGQHNQPQNPGGHDSPEPVGEGTPGPPGEPGPQGEQGPQGEPGTPAKPIIEVPPLIPSTVNTVDEAVKGVTGTVDKATSGLPVQTHLSGE